MALYSGAAEITDIAPEEISEGTLKTMSPEDAARAFQIRYQVRTPEGSFHDIKLEFSKRELKGSLLRVFATRIKGRNPCQMDVSLDTLKRQGIIPEAKEDYISDALNPALIGRKVNIVQKEGGIKEDGTQWPPSTYFSNGPARLSGNDLAARIAALTGKPAPAPAPAPAAEVVTPEVVDDGAADDGLPF